jgi:hypothetical protein
MAGEGPPKKNRRTQPCIWPKSQTHPPTIRLLFFLTFFFSTFLGVSRQGEFKNTIQIFWQKVRVENFPQNFDKNFDVSFSSTFFVLSHFRVFFSDGISKTLQKTFCKKNRVEKFLQKIRPEVQNRLFLDFVYHVFGRFLVRGVQKHDKKYLKQKSVPSPFLASDPPTHGSHRFCFYWRPLDGWLRLAATANTLVALALQFKFKGVFLWCF